MNRAVVGAVFGAALAWVSPAAAEGEGHRGAPGTRPLVVAQADAFQEQKQAYLIDAEREIGVLASQVAKLSEVTPTEGGANPGFADAKRDFSEKMAAAQAKLAALRSTPGDYAQSAMTDVDLALADLRAAFSKVTDAVK